MSALLPYTEETSMNAPTNHWLQEPGYLSVMRNGWCAVWIAHLRVDKPFG